MNAVHLTDDQIDELLMGDGADDVRAHVTACAACRERVVEERSALALFRDASMAWGERRSTGMPLPSARAAARPAWMRAPVLTAAAVLVAAGLGISVVKNFEGRRSAVAERGALRLEAGRNSAAQIAADNRMLSEIDQALTADAPSLLEASQTGEASRSGRKAAEVRD